MCELLGLSFAKSIPADFSIREFALRSDENADGWGLGWYPDQSVAIVKEPLRWQASAHTGFLETYSNLQAPIYIAHVRHKTTGGVATLPALIWSSVPHADRYQVTLYDEAGSVLWETHTADTAVAVPETVRLIPGVPHYWKVAARTELGRWVASDLTSFTLRRARPRR